MKKLFLLQLFLLLACKSTLVPTCDYEKYFEEITKALTERHSNNNLEKSVELFKEAINNVPVANGKDLEEALQASIELGDMEFAQDLVVQLATGGIPIQYFERYEKLIAAAWWPKIERNYVKYEDFYKENFNLLLREKLLAIAKRDSTFNSQKHQFRRGEREMSLNKMIAEARAIHEIFKDFIENVFPSQKNIGYYYENGKIADYSTTAILIHIHGRGEYLLNDKYEQLVCSGHLSRYEYESINNLTSQAGGKGIEHEMKTFYDKYIGAYHE